jgi:hypothetical protein
MSSLVGETRSGREVGCLNKRRIRGCKGKQKIQIKMGSKKKKRKKR